MMDRGSKNHTIVIGAMWTESESHLGSQVLRCYFFPQYEGDGRDTQLIETSGQCSLNEGDQVESTAKPRPRVSLQE